VHHRCGTLAGERFCAASAASEVADGAPTQFRHSATLSRGLAFKVGHSFVVYIERSFNMGISIVAMARSALNGPSSRKHCEEALTM
jgi:hypothetical protein